MFIINGAGIDIHKSSIFGDYLNGNYSEFEADGTYEALGNARTFRDEIGDATSLKVTGVGVSLNTTESVVEFTTGSDLNDFILKNIQLNHDRDLTATYVYPHIHWFQTENKVPNFLLEYRWQINGGVKVTGWSRLKMNYTPFTYTSGTLHQICNTLSGVAVPVGTALSDVLQVKIYRDNANASTVFAGVNEYTTTVGILSLDVHIPTNTLGSRTEYSK